jgi:DNA-directed RNA polymerase subunit alpha
MSKIRNLGQKSLEEIEKKLKELNLSFKKTEE